MEMFNIKAEQSVLGSLFTNDECLALTGKLTSQMFSQDAHQKIYKAVRFLEKNKQPIDIVTVAELLDKHNHLKACGGIGYLGELAQSSIGGANFERYCQIIIEKFTTRNFHLTLHNALKNVEVGNDIQNEISSLVGTLASILEGSLIGEPTRINDILLERVDRIEKMQDGLLKPISTGFENFDEKFNGFSEGDLIILAGRPSMGKTALGVQLAEQISTVQQSALVFSLEMTVGQLTDRMISGNSRVSSNRLFRANSLTEEDYERLGYGIGLLNNKNLFVDDRTFTVQEMKAKAQAIKRKHGLSIVVIDYLQLMSVGEGRFGNREQEISSISRELKRMAKELGVPVVALSQLSRKVEERQDKRPLMSDLRESGALEQDADMIMFVYRDEYYNPDTQYKGSAEVICAKNRNGETGKIFLTFENEHTRFVSHVGSEPTYEPQKKGSRGSYYDE